MKVDYIVCVDMGKEFPEMYEHWKQIEEYTGSKLTILKLPKSYDYYMFDHLKTKGKNKGKRGYGWAQSGIRWCTTLKTQLINRFLRSLNEPTSSLSVLLLTRRSGARTRTIRLSSGALQRHRHLSIAVLRVLTGVAYTTISTGFHAVAVHLNPFQSLE